MSKEDDSGGCGCFVLILIILGIIFLVRGCPKSEDYYEEKYKCPKIEVVE